MEKERQPTLWGNHDFDSLANGAFQRTEEGRRLRVVIEMLDLPDSYENSNVDTAVPWGSLTLLNSMTIPVLGMGLSPKLLGRSTIDAKLFNPHERVDVPSSSTPMEVSTSVVAFDAYKGVSIEQDGAKAGSILLFKLSANLIGEPVTDITAKDLAWGENCSYGAFVDNKGIRYFGITRTSGGTIHAESRRKDLIEESGQFVETQVVTSKGDQLTLRELSSSSEEAIELDQEMEKFIQSRQWAVALDRE